MSKKITYAEVVEKVAYGILEECNVVISPEMSEVLREADEEGKVFEEDVDLKYQDKVINKICPLRRFNKFLNLLNRFVL